MPPSGEPLKEQILQDIETALKLIDGGASYYTTVVDSYVQRGDKSKLEITGYPFLELTPMFTEYDTEPRETKVLQLVSARFKVAITGYLKTRSNAARDVERFTRDIHTAMLVDVTRGGLATWTQLVRDEPWYQTDTTDPICGVDMLFEILYRADRTDLNTAK